MAALPGGGPALAAKGCAQLCNESNGSRQHRCAPSRSLQPPNPEATPPLQAPPPSSRCPPVQTGRDLVSKDYPRGAHQHLAARHALLLTAGATVCSRGAEQGGEGGEQRTHHGALPRCASIHSEGQCLRCAAVRAHMHMGQASDTHPPLMPRTMWLPTCTGWQGAGDKGVSSNAGLRSGAMVGGATGNPVPPHSLPGRHPARTPASAQHRNAKKYCPPPEDLPGCRPPSRGQESSA